MTDILYRRLLFGTVSHGAGPGASRFAATFARALNLQFAALYIEDEDLLSLAALPFAREATASAAMRRIDVQALERDLARNASMIRRRLEAAAREVGLGLSFEVRRGRVADTLKDLALANDIIAVPLPSAATERLGRGLADLVAAAFACSASVLFLPETGTWRGPSGIVAWLDGASDADVLDVASSIARAGDMPLGIVRAPGTRLAPAEIEARLGARRATIVDAVAPEEPVSIDTANAFLVLARSNTGLGSLAGLEAALERRRAPLLLLEPALARA